MGTAKDRIDGDRLWAEIEAFGRIGGNGRGAVTRLAFSREDLQAREKMIDILTGELGLQVRIDAIGNIFARREGRRPELPIIMTGSHLDTVRNGGMFDGAAGVICSLEVFRALNDLDLITEHPFELAVFSAEEPNRFGLSTFGSRGMTGKLRMEDPAALTDEKSAELKAALAGIGGDLDRLPEAIRPAGEIEYFVEVHIEQMPTLARRGFDIGLVSGIGGIHRQRLTLKGEVGHSGTTPMAGRKDALCAASEIILALERAADQQAEPTVATVGRINVSPNVVGAIPGLVEMDAEIRSTSSDIIQSLAATLAEEASAAAGQRGVTIDSLVFYRTQPVAFAREVRQAAGLAAEELGLKSMEVSSLAGHDAAHLNAIAKAGMIFLPSKNGASHCPEEWTSKEELTKGARCLLRTLLLLDGHESIPRFSL